MVVRMQRFVSFLVVMLIMWMGLPGCGGGGDSPNAPEGTTPQSAPQVSVDSPQNLGTVTLQPGTSSEELFVDVRGSSFMLIAEGETFTSDIDIHSVVDPSGATLVTDNQRDNDAIGKNLLNIPGGSAVAGLFPHTTDYNIQTGRYSFQVRNNDFVERTIIVKAILKHGVNPSGGTLNVNLVFCGVPGLSASNALLGETPASQKFLIGFNEFKRILRDAAHIEIATPTLLDCSPESAKFTTVFSGVDSNRNGQSDELDLLFGLHRQEEQIGLSFNLPDSALTFYFIPTIEPGLFEPSGGTILGVSGGIPGPAFTPGTRHSGVAVSTLGAPAILPDDLARGLGRTMAHEAAHFLGLFHTTESDGLYDPLSDTPECPKGNDVDVNGLEASECINFDGQNLMFWDGNSSGAQLTDGQRLVLHRNPLIH